MIKRVAGLVLLAALFLPRATMALEIRVKGKLEVSPGASLLPVSTDPVVQRVLSEDFTAAKRGGGQAAKTALTLTVTLTQRTLRPGVSLAELSPGDPDVVELLKAAGAEPPPVADTGSAPTDPYESAARIAATRPPDPELAELQRLAGSAMPGFFPDYDPKNYLPHSGGDAAEVYDRAIVARVSASGAGGEMTIVAVMHPGDDAREVRKLIAEKIANMVLR